MVYRFSKLAVETHICVWSLNGSRKYYQAISFNDETQICVSTACTPTPKLLQLINGRFDVAAVDVDNRGKKELVFATGAGFNHGVGPGSGNKFAQGIAAVGRAGHRLRTPEGSPVPLTAAVAQEAAGIVAVVDQFVAAAPARM